MSSKLKHVEALTFGGTMIYNDHVSVRKLRQLMTFPFPRLNLILEILSVWV